MPAAMTESADLSVLAETLRAPLLRLSRRLRHESLKVGLSAQDAIIMGFIRRYPGSGVSALADFDQTSRPTMSSHVKRLEALGWVRRAEDANDGRRSGLTVTTAGIRKLDLLKRRRNDWLVERLALLSPAERDGLAAAAPALHKLMAVDA